MAKMPYIESSPRKERSHSRAVAKAFVDACWSARANVATEVKALAATL